MAKRRRSRLWLTLAAIIVVGGGIGAAFIPKPVAVDMGQVTRGPMLVTIDEEGRTEVRESYTVSTPVAGQLLRVSMHAGDVVKGGETVVARMRPINPAFLDVRTREQANAAVSAAEAGLKVAEADVESASAAAELAQSALERTRALSTSGTVSQAALDRAVTEARAAQARLQTAEAAVAVRQADVENARALLISFDDPTGTAASETDGQSIPLKAPIDGVILRIVQESETTMPAGAPVMVIGDIDADLEVVVDLVSSDAVQVGVGDRVILDNWGGADLGGEVVRIDPFGTTSVSALGVAEQRVNVAIAFTSPAIDRPGLGDGYRIEARIVTWEDPQALIVPASALFRDGAQWAVFTVSQGTARLTHVDIGHVNGIEAEVTGGLSEGDTVVLYPAAGLVEGADVVARVVE